MSSLLLEDLPLSDKRAQRLSLSRLQIDRSTLRAGDCPPVWPSTLSFLSSCIVPSIGHHQARLVENALTLGAPDDSISTADGTNHTLLLDFPVPLSNTTFLVQIACSVALPAVGSVVEVGSWRRFLTVDETIGF